MNLTALPGKTLEALRKRIYKHADISVFEKQELERLDPKSALWQGIIPGGVPERVAIMAQFANGSLARISPKQDAAIRAEYLKIVGALPKATQDIAEKIVRRIEKVPGARKAAKATATPVPAPQTPAQAAKPAAPKPVKPLKPEPGPKPAVTAKPAKAKKVRKAKKKKIRKAAKTRPTTPKLVKPLAAVKPKGAAAIPAVPKSRHQSADHDSGPRIILAGCPGEFEMRRERGALILRINASEAVLDKVRVVVRGE